VGLCNCHTLCTCAARVELPLHTLHGLQDITQEFYKLHCAPAAVKSCPAHVLCSYSLLMNHTTKLTQPGVAGTCQRSISCTSGDQQAVHLALEGGGAEPSPEGGGVEPSPEGEGLSPHQKAIATTEAVREATGSQLLWSQAVTVRLRHTADDVTAAVTVAMAMATPVAPEATAADSQATNALVMATAAAIKATAAISQAPTPADSKDTSGTAAATAVNLKATAALAMTSAARATTTAALAKATAAGAQIEVALARAPSAKAAVPSAVAESTITDNNTADATNVIHTGANPKVESETDQLRRQLLVSQQSQAVEARLAACQAHNSELQRQLELRQKSQSAAVGTAAALGINVIQLQRQLKAAKAKEAAAEARAAAAEHAVLQLMSVSQMVVDLHEVRSSSSVLVDALAHGVAALSCIMIFLICSATS
jgi:hypothetical protein